MTGFNYIIDLTVLNGGAFGKLASMAGGFENSLERAQGEVGQTEKKLNNMGRTGQSVFSGLRSSVMSWVAGLGIAAATIGSLQTAAQNEGLKSVIEFSGGAEGAKNLAFVRSEVDRLGLPLRDSLEGFGLLSGAMMGSGVEADKQREIFQGLAEGLATFRVPAEKANRALIALSQMASKGTVSSEELKGQMGEALPGSFGIAAQAMGVTTSALQDMLDKGDIMANDFLPKFAAELHKSFGQSAMDAANSATANFNRMQTALFDLKVMVGEKLMPTALNLIQNFLVPAVSWIGRNIDALSFLAVTIGGVWAAYKVYSIWVAVADWGTKGFMVSINALTTAMYANPIGLIVAGLIAIGVAVYYAWNHFEGFRGVVYGVWEVLKPIGTFLYDVLTWQFRALGNVLQWVWEKTDGMRKGFVQWMDSLKEIGTWIWENLIKPFSLVGQAISLLEPLFSKAGVSIGNTFTEGWNKGIADFGGSNSPAVAGALGGTTFATPGAGDGTGKGNSKASELSNSITGGGQRNITINVSKLNEGGITIHTTNLKEGASEVEAMLMKLMLQVVNSGNQQQGK